MGSRAKEFAVGVAGVVVGALVVLSINALQSTPSQQRPQDAEEAGLRSAVLELTSHIDDLRRALPSPSSSGLAPPSTPSQREEVANPHQDEVLAKLERTIAALETLCDTLKDSP